MRLGCYALLFGLGRIPGLRLGDGLVWQRAGRAVVLPGLVCVLGQVALSRVSSLGLEIASSLAPVAAVLNAALNVC